MKSYGVTIQMKATKQYFPVVLFIMLYKVVLTFMSGDETRCSDHSNEIYCAAGAGSRGRVQGVHTLPPPLR